MYLGIDIGGTYIKYALLDHEFQIKKFWKKKTLFFHSVEDLYNVLCEDIDTSEIELIGVSAPGIIDPNSGEVRSRAADQIAVMCGSNPKEEIKKRLNCPVEVLNDGKAAGYCEVRKGNGQNTSSSVYWVIGTGIGGCVCRGMEIVEGKDGIAGEFSHIPVAIDNSKRCALGDVTSVGALVRIYNRHAKEATKVEDAKEVCELYLAGDMNAKNAVDEWVDNQIQGFQILTVIYNPEVICIGGAISKENWLIDKIRKRFYETAFRFSDIMTTRIEVCQYGNDANLLGAVMYACDRLL